MSKEQRMASLKQQARSTEEQLDKVMGWIHELEDTERGPGESASTTERKKGEATSRRVSLDADECIACASCVAICPLVFAMREDGEAAVVIKETGGPEDLIQDAINNCPLQCIAWEKCRIAR
jgi:ferredoxin